jgi:rhodanese-related sulfurtransferase
MDGSKSPHISRQDLYGAIGTAAAPVIIDVRRSAAFTDDKRMIAGAIRRNPDEIENWREKLPSGRAVVVYCVHGHEASQNSASALRGTGADARYLEDGIAGWAEHRLPMRSKRDTEQRSWVTRERPKIDRIACPWLIRRFIDPEAEFLFVPTERVFAAAAEAGATAYDIPGAEPFSHDGELCSFDAFLKVYDINDRALEALALIVRGADTARLELTPQSPGLLALSLGSPPISQTTTPCSRTGWPCTTPSTPGAAPCRAKLTIGHRRRAPKEKKPWPR